MEQVSKDVFYDYINPRDIIIKSSFKHDSNGFCYESTTEFKTRGNFVVGKSITNYENETKEYFLIKER